MCTRIDRLTSAMGIDSPPALRPSTGGLNLEVRAGYAAEPHFDKAVSNSGTSAQQERDLWAAELSTEQ